jgi:acetyltransferase-like isoleucine patch superfamily enzyme
MDQSKADRPMLTERLFQSLRKLHVLWWRTTRRLYWNAHHNTAIPRDARIATTCRLELETGGSIRMGRSCQLTNFAIISPYGGRVSLGDRVYIGHHSIIYGHGGVTIGDDTMVAAHVVIVAMSHAYSDVETPIAQQPITKKGIKIGRDCWIGAGVKILDGVEIGDGCVVGAGAVVTRSIPALSISVGVPAKKIQMRS